MPRSDRNDEVGDYDCYSYRDGVGDEAVLRLLQVALAEARRFGLNEDDAHDCAMALVLHALQQCHPACEPERFFSEPSVHAPLIITRLILRADLPPDQTDFWLRRCARNFASKWQRSQNCRKRHEATGSNTGWTAEALSLLPSARRAASAEEVALASLLRRDVQDACGQLPPSTQTLFERFHLHGDTTAEIALSSGTSEKAVKQSAYRARLKVRVALAAQGYGGHAPKPFSIPATASRPALENN